MTFAFIEGRRRCPFCEPGVEPVGDRESAVGEVRGAAAVAAAGLVDACAHNRRRGRKDVRLFETGSRFTRAGEGRAAAFAWTGAAADAALVGAGPRRSISSTSRASVELLCAALGVPSRVEFAAVASSRTSCRAGPRTYSPRRRRTLGVVGQLAPAIAEARGFPAGEADLRRRDRPRRARAVRPPTSAPRRVAAALSVDRPRPLDPRRRSLACRGRSWHYPFGGARRRWCRSSSSIAIRARACRKDASACRCGSRSASRSHADGRRSAAGDGPDRRGPPRSARRRAAIARLRVPRSSRRLEVARASASAEVVQLQRN